MDVGCGGLRKGGFQTRPSRARRGETTDARLVLLALLSLPRTARGNHPAACGRHPSTEGIGDEGLDVGYERVNVLCGV
ncbi:MAG: hypothetical protein LBM98_02135 [Oscillospiraceae bacterium]|nr:hypothetical protein [Oscillospiraceae bacterium]